MNVPRGMQLRSITQRTIPPPRVARTVKRPPDPLRPVKSPTRSHQPVLGLPSDLDRLDPTGRLLEMDPGRPIAMARGNHAAVSTWRANKAGTAFAQGERWKALKIDSALAQRPRFADWDQTDALRTFKTDARDRVVSIWSRAIDKVEDVKAIALREMQTGGHGRVWQVWDQKLKKKTFYRFDQAKRPPRDFWAQLSNADGPNAVRLLRRLETTGFMQVSGDPEGVFGSIAPRVDVAGKPF